MTQPEYLSNQHATQVSMGDELNTWCTPEGYKVPIAHVSPDIRETLNSLQHDTSLMIAPARSINSHCLVQDLYQDIQTCYRQLQHTEAVRTNQVPLELAPRDLDEVVRVITECMMPVEVGVRYAVNEAIRNSTRINFSTVGHQMHTLYFATALAKLMYDRFLKQGYFHITISGAVEFPYFYHTFTGAVLYLMNDRAAFADVSSFGL